jgi:L-threonylcarbamoyladenylate synthase
MQSKIINDHTIAAQLLHSGKLVSFPTETVYGLGADASNLTAVAQVFQLKKRPINHPLIVHIGTSQSLNELACHIPDYAHRLAAHFWPGPITLVLPKTSAISEIITGGQDTVAIRMPAHELTLKLLADFPLGLVGPSANQFGRISPTCAADVIDELGQQELLAAVLDGGRCTVGIESTIIDCSGAEPAILRHGQISIEAIEQVLNLNLTPKNNPPRVSGNLKSHYSPQALTLLAEYPQILAFIKKYPYKKIAVLSLQASPFLDNFTNHWLQESSLAANYAQNLYKNLRSLDHLNPDYILIETPPQTIMWQGINDRLSKASSKAKIVDLLVDKTSAHA